MILLDASVLIEFFRNHDARLERALNQLPLGICGVTRSEILHGARDDADEVRLAALLDKFAAIQTPQLIWDDLGRNLGRLRRSGVVLPLPDALVATIALREDLEVWSLDRHFALLRDVLGVRLHEERWT